jgi:glycosyltransferase involved in cell wall biosynthesis
MSMSMNFYKDLEGRLPLVHILMATCEGERYLGEQLASIQSQTYPHWVLHVSDDASTDSTLEVLKAFDKTLETLDLNHERQSLSSSRVFYYSGPKKGSTQNFLHLVQSVMARYDQEVDEVSKTLARQIGVGAAGGQQRMFHQEDLFAFADQDDVWLPEKLERAVAWLMSPRPQQSQKKPFDRNEVGLKHETTRPYPMLYAARTIKVDAHLKPLGQSKLPKGPLNFNAALVENTLSGNTMVMNLDLMKILRLIELDHAVWHDWSTYQVASACLGEIKFDEKPCLLYRQHADNVIGVREGLLDQSIRMVRVLQGRYKSWTETNLLGLKDIEDQMSLESLELVSLYREIRACQSFWLRLSLIGGLHIRRQNIFFQFLIYVGLLGAWV